MTMVFCRGCGKEIHESAATCPHCGAVQAPTRLVPRPLKSQTAAALWCFFLGGVGAHRFYLRKIVTGVLSVLFCWTSIPGIVACFDLLIIAFSSPESWARKYNDGVLTPPTHWAVKILAVLLPGLFIVGLVAGIAASVYDHYIVNSHPGTTDLRFETRFERGATRRISVFRTEQGDRALPRNDVP